MSALRSYDLEFDWCVNIHEDKDTFEEVTQPFYDAVFPNWWSLENGLQRFISTY
jgi:dethiobiotin synthetase